MRTIGPKAYDERVAAQDIQFQIDNYYEPKSPPMRRRVERVIEKIAPRREERILDIGCGVGTFAYRCAAAGAFSAGVDYSFESIKTARLLCARYGVGANARFFVADGTRLPFKGRYFDKAVAADFIEHISDEDKERMLEELNRILKDEGTAVIFTPNGIREKIGSIYWRMRHALFGKRIPTTELHIGLTTKDAFERLCKKKGLTFRMSYEDTTRPYLAKMPFIRRFLALDLLWTLKKGKMDIRNILVVNLGGIGDVLFSTPALRALKNLYPAAEISMLVDPRVRDTAAGLPYIFRAYIFHMGFAAADGLSNFAENLKTLIELRRRRFDLAVNMRTLVSGLGAFKIRMLLAIIGPRITAGRNTDGRGAFFDIAIPETVKGEKHEMEYDVELVERLGGKVEDKRIDYLIDDEGAKKARKILEEAGIADNDIVVGVHPGGKPSHRWPIGNFAEAMRQIAGKVNCSFIITGDSEEAPLADALAQTCGVKAMNTAGAVTIKEFGALVKRCRAFISNDTAAMHIAALSGVPLVAIFGPGYLLRFDPRKISDRAKVLYKKADCAPCDKETCASLGCLKSISPHEVAKAALALLGVEKEG